MDLVMASTVRNQYRSPLKLLAMFLAPGILTAAAYALCVGAVVDRGLPKAVALGIAALVVLVPAELVIVYLSDNGSPRPAIEAPYNPARDKGSVFEGGVRVPMLVVAPGITTPGSVSSELVHTADLFPTVAELAGIDLTRVTHPRGRHRGEPLHLDGHSLVPVLRDPGAETPREFLFSEMFYPNGRGPYEYLHRTVRNDTHKLVREVDTQGQVTEAFYDLNGGAYDEGPARDVTALSPDEQAQYAALIAEMDRLDDTLAVEW